jgi:hypothetical protein
MATITLGMVSTPFTGSKTYTSTDADMQALLNWAAAALNPQIQRKFNPGGTPGFVPTNAQIAVVIADDFIQGLIARVQQAGVTVVQTVPPGMGWV